MGRPLIGAMLNNNLLNHTTCRRTGSSYCLGRLGLERLPSAKYWKKGVEATFTR